MPEGTPLEAPIVFGAAIRQIIFAEAVFHHAEDREKVFKAVLPPARRQRDFRLQSLDPAKQVLDVHLTTLFRRLPN